jgi:phosphoglycolate phosphatase
MMFSCKNAHLLRGRGTIKSISSKVPHGYAAMDKETLLNKSDAFVFDCDGVIWKGDTLIPGVREVLEKLRKIGKSVFFVTNNSTKSRIGYMDKFTSLGLHVREHEIFTSSYAAAVELQRNPLDDGQQVYVLGESGICDELDQLGIKHCGGPSDAGKVPVGDCEHIPNVGAVVVGLDRAISYYKIQTAQLCLQDPKCRFIATNADATAHLTPTQKWAGSGCIVGAIQGCSKRIPQVVGKPSSLLMDILLHQNKELQRKRIVMVGDRLDTDIVFGRSNGLQTLLVLSGVTDTAMLERSSANAIIPDFVCDSVADLL